MSISFHILPRDGLIYVRYSGHMRIAESREAFLNAVKDPGFRPGMKQLVDLSGVTGWERDFAGLMALQARKAEAFHTPDQPSMVVAIAPTALTREIANIVCRTWDGIDGIHYLVAENEAEAIAILGLREASIADLLRTV